MLLQCPSNNARNPYQVNTEVFGGKSLVWVSGTRLQVYWLNSKNLRTSKSPNSSVISGTELIFNFSVLVSATMPQSVHRQPCRYRTQVPCALIALGFGVLFSNTVRSKGVSPPHIPQVSLIPASKQSFQTGQRLQTSLATP